MHMVRLPPRQREIDCTDQKTNCPACKIWITICSGVVGSQIIQIIYLSRGLKHFVCVLEVTPYSILFALQWLTLYGNGRCVMPLSQPTGAVFRARSLDNHCRTMTYVFGTHLGEILANADVSAWHPTTSGGIEHGKSAQGGM